MKKSDFLFALLRKSAVLKDECKKDSDRKFLIELKYQYSKLQPSLRNMIRVMATEIDRFDLEHGKIESISAVMDNYHTSGSERPETGNGHPVLVDSVSSNRFVIMRNTIISNGVIVFKGDDHQAFVVAYGCLVRAKIQQEKIIKQNAEEERRRSILSEFL